MKRFLMQNSFLKLFVLKKCFRQLTQPHIVLNTYNVARHAHSCILLAFMPLKGFVFLDLDDAVQMNAPFIHASSSRIVFCGYSGNVPPESFSCCISVIFLLLGLLNILKAHARRHLHKELIEVAIFIFHLEHQSIKMSFFGSLS